MIEKLQYSNGGSWPQNLNVLEGYVKKVIDNQNELIDRQNKIEVAVRYLAGYCGGKDNTIMPSNKINEILK